MAAKKHVLSLKTGRVGFKRTKAQIKKPSKDAKRVKTAIPGFDDVTEGGFESGSTNLIVGGAGSGKTIFSTQFLINGIDKFGENGLYLTFEEDKEKLAAHLSKFGWDFQGYKKKGNLAVIEFSPEQVERFLQEGGGIIESTISKINAKRIVLDSLTAFLLLYKGELERKKACLTLFKMLQKWGCTSLLIAEHEPDPEKHVSSLLEFETDSVILLYNVKKGDFREREMEILKMRGTHHSSSIFPMKITNKGISIFPEDAIF